MCVMKLFSTKPISLYAIFEAEIEYKPKCNNLVILRTYRKYYLIKIISVTTYTYYTLFSNNLKVTLAEVFTYRYY